MAGGRRSSSGEEEDSEEDQDEQAQARAVGAAGAGRAGAAGLAARTERYEDRKGLAAGVRGSGEVVDAGLLKPWQLMREKYKSRKRAVGGREAATLARLEHFKSALKGSGTVSAGQGAGAGQAAEAEAAGPAGGQGHNATSGASSSKYSGKVREDIDHKAYQPAAWRVDDYASLEQEDAGGLAELRAHKLVFGGQRAGGQPADAMARQENLDDYVVHDPLLEAAKGKFSRAAQAEKKRGKEWAGRSVT